MTCDIIVIVPMRNDKAYLPGFLISLAEQTYSRFQLILVDNASDDGTYETARYLAEPFAERATVVHTDMFVGMWEAYRLGLNAANTEEPPDKYAICLTPRCKMNGDFLQRMHAYMLRSNIGAIDGSDASRPAFANQPKFLPELQRKQLELFKQFATFAKKHDLTYYALGGTLLGAVRHKGFIPWDDDIDIGLPRKDYDRFIELVQDGRVPFKVRSFQTNDCFFERFPQMVDDSIQVVRHDRSIPEVTGAWIDFFPLDGAPKASRVRWLWSKWMRLHIGLHRLSCIDINGFGTGTVGKSTALQAIVKLNELVPFGKIINRRWALARLDKTARFFSFEQSNFVNHSMSSRLPYMFPKAWYEPGAWYLFEDTEVFGPSNFDAVLSQLYEDYLTPPPEEEKGRHFKKEIE